MQEDDHLLHLLSVGMEEVLEEVGHALVRDVSAHQDVTPVQEKFCAYTVTPLWHVLEPAKL